MQFLYRYITHPKQTILEYVSQPIGRYSILTLTLVAFMNISFFLPGILLQQIWMMGIFAWLLFSEAVVMDFMAQVFGYQGQSYRLFQWLCLSWLPFLLLPPLNVLSQSFGLGVGGIMLLILGLVLYLQVITFKTLYQANTTAVLGFYLLPIFVFMLSVMVFFMVIGTMMGSLFSAGGFM